MFIEKESRMYYKCGVDVIVVSLILIFFIFYLYGILMLFCFIFIELLELGIKSCIIWKYFKVVLIVKLL